MRTKFIFITGGVVSSLGKGITAASIGQLLESRGIKIAMLKLDPYLNVDPGTMSPYQHGEVYVTDDGAETDLDLGHYYRFTNSPLSKASNATSGQIYDTVIKRERKGDYLGNTVQVIPHVTDTIQERILSAAAQEEGVQVTVVEIGGTIGDIESLPFLEAIRQFCYARPQDCINIHLTYVPFLKAAGEVKTKPTQHSVQALRAIGIIPDFILCRSEGPLSSEIKEKISLFCSVSQEAVFDEKDVESSIYEVPLELFAQGLDVAILKKLQLEKKPADLSSWQEMVSSLNRWDKEITIGVVGKYVEHQDAYKSVFEAMHHAAIALKCKLNIEKFQTEEFLENTRLELCHGFIVPGGFGERGWDSKLAIAKYARENEIPYFGLCLGMQVLIVEFARNLLGLKNAHSTEVDPNTPDPVISLLTEQKGIENLGGTMRLGAYPCALEKESLAFKAYGKNVIFERHRHRYEFNNAYKKRFEEAHLLFSGTLHKGDLIEIAEIPSHPWMLGVQFHPEFQSKPLKPHPLFYDFLSTCLLLKERVLSSLKKL